MSTAVDHKPLIAYYVRTGFARGVISACDDWLKRRGNDSTLLFWRAVANARECSYPTAIREAEALRGKRDAEYASLLALRYFHRLNQQAGGATTAETDAAVAAVEAALPAAAARCVGAGLLLASHFQWLVLGDVPSAREGVNRILRDNAAHEGANTLRGWIEVTRGQPLPCRGPPVTTSTPSPFNPRAPPPPASASASGVPGFCVPLSMGGPAAAPPPAGVAGRGSRGADDTDDAAAASEAIAYFEAAIAAAGGSASGGGSSAAIDATMGLARAYERRGDYAAAVEAYSSIVGDFNWMVPAACEQARLFMKTGDWTNAADAIAGVMAVDRTNIECLRLSALAALLREGATSLRSVSLAQDLMAALAATEPRTGRLWYDCSRVLASVACRARTVVGVTVAMADHACKCEPRAAAYASEIGRQRLMLGDASGAAAAFAECSRLDEDTPDAVPGTIAAQLQQGLVEDAEGQLEMARLLLASDHHAEGGAVGTAGADDDGGATPSPVLSLLSAQVAWRRHRDRAAALAHVEAAAGAWAANIGLLPMTTTGTGNRFLKCALSRAAARVSTACGVPVGALATEGGGGAGGVGDDGSSGGGGGGLLDGTVIGASASGGGGVSDGLPLPLLLPGAGADLFEWYYQACLDTTLLDAAASVLLSNADRTLVAPVEAAAAAEVGGADGTGAPGGGGAHGRDTGASGGGASTTSSSAASSSAATAAAGVFSALLAAVPHPSIAAASLAEPSSVPAALASVGKLAAAAVRGALTVDPDTQRPLAAGTSGGGGLLTVTPAIGGLALLTTLASIQPGHAFARLLAASVFIACGRVDVAVAQLSDLLKADPACTEGHMLLAHACLDRGDPRTAAAALQAALSSCLGLQETASFMRLKACVLAGEGRWEEATAAAEAATAALGTGSGGAAAAARGGRSAASAAASSSSGGGGGGGGGRAGTLCLQERSSLALLYAECLLHSDRIADATRAVTAAVTEFRGTSEETRVAVAAARLALRKGDPDAALALAGSVPHTSPSYQAAVSLRAHIHLTHRKDRRMFLQAFTDLVARQRTDATLTALGDAYMRIQMPVEAVEAYEQALAMRPGNAALAATIGRALSRMHDYGRAVDYYQAALARMMAAAAAGGAGSGDSPSPAASSPLPSPESTYALRSDLIELLVRLRRFDEAQSLIASSLEGLTGAAAGSGADTSAGADGDAPAAAAATAGGGSGGGGVGAVIAGLRYARRNLQLLARLQSATGRPSDAIAALRQALSVQARLVSLARREPAVAATGLLQSSSVAANIVNAIAEAASAASAAPAGAVASSTASAAGGAGGVGASSTAAGAATTALTAASSGGASVGGAAATSAASASSVIPTPFSQAVAGGGGGGGTAGSGAPSLPPRLTPADIERLEASSLCHALGTLHETGISPPDDDAAHDWYRQAARYADSINEYAGTGSDAAGATTSAAAGAAAVTPPLTLRETALLALAQLHLRRGEAEECRLVCREITSANPGCEAAALMLAELLFRQGEASAATYHYSTLLEQRPNAYAALARLVTLLKRAGRVNDAQRFIARALRARPAAEATDAGYRFCRGLQALCTSDVHEGIRLLNTVRLTGAWGTQATHAMVWTYLSPDNDPLWLERGSGSASSAAASGGAAAGAAAPAAGEKAGRDAASIAEALRVAERLLDDLPLASRGPMHAVLASYVLLGYRTRTSIEEATGKLESLLKTHPEYPPALMALATAAMLGKKEAAARAALKRFFACSQDVEHWADWVRAHLLQADLHMAANKLEQAGESLRSALALDSSCARAYEYLAAIAEREGRFGDAASLYELAWRHENEASAPVGFKLAYNHLRSGRYVPCIDVCHKILKQYPDYPRIREEVLNKARAAVRS